MASVKRNRRSEGIVLVVIGSIIIVFSVWYAYIIGLQAPGYAGGGAFPIIVGVVILVIGLCFLAPSFSGTKDRTRKQAKPIT